MAAPKVREMQV